MEDLDYIKYSLAFALCDDIGPRTFDKLLAKFKNPKRAYTAKPFDLELIIGPKKTTRFLKFRESYRADSTLFEMNKKYVQIIVPRLPQWVNTFAFCSDNPICLFAKGDISLLSKKNTITISIVGTRRPTPYGKHVTENLTRDLVHHDIIIMSGLALGIDAIAHQKCLNENGKTIAILGSGIDEPYPAHHQGLYEEILAKGGLILSEYPPGTPALPHHFIQRNRLISALSQGLVVIEGAECSGTLITAKYAGEQGKTVFAVPGPITSALSFAPNHLIQQGACLITSAYDILTHYKIDVALHTQTHTNLSPIEQNLLQLITENPARPDDLFKITQESKENAQNYRELLSTLSLLEVKGYIVREADGKYYLNSNPTPSIPP